MVCLDPNQDKNDPLRGKRTRERRYAFDMAFGPEVDSATVFENTTNFLVDGVLNGFNATVFAYGPTGAGKTYSMLGTPEQPGIMVLTLRDMFEKSAAIEADDSRGVTFKVSLSYLEVYNENLRDLLVPQQSAYGDQ